MNEQGAENKASAKIPLQERQKFALLRSAMKKGLSVFTSEAIRIARDKFWSQKYLIFRLDVRDLRTPPTDNVPPLRFRQIQKWEDLPDSTRHRMLVDGKRLNCGDIKWFGRGWKLFLGELDGTPAALCWWSAAQESKFFCEAMQESRNCELIWQAATFPEFRGKKFYTKILFALVQSRMKSGVTTFLIMCSDYNTTSMNTILGLGFKQIGYQKINRLTQKWIWKHRAF